MTVLTTEKLGATVGAAVVGVDRDRLLQRRRRCRPGSSRPSRPTAPSSFVACTSTMPRRWRSASGWAASRSSARASTPRSSGSRSTRRRTPRPQYLRGTFDWHIDGCTDDVPIMATILSAHAVAESGGETEFASTYAAYDDLVATRRRSATCRYASSTPFEASQRLVNNDPSPEELAIWRSRPSKEHPLVWTHQSGRRSLVLGATASHVVGMDHRRGSGAAGRPPGAGRPPPSASTGTSGQVGDLVIWDNRGVLHRACPYDAASPRDMHRTTLHGDEPIQ